MQSAGPYLLSFAAAGFLYVALADLVPTQREPSSLPGTLLDLLLTAAGIGVIAAVARG
jgi:zinc transporter ZupT